MCEHCCLVNPSKAPAKPETESKASPVPDRSHHSHLTARDSNDLTFPVVAQTEGATEIVPNRGEVHKLTFRYLHMAQFSDHASLAMREFAVWPRFY
jgi:hypothetical protein